MPNAVVTMQSTSMKAQTMIRVTTRIVLVAGLFFLSHSARAAEMAPGADTPRQLAIELGAPFCDTMVLQRESREPAALVENLPSDHDVKGRLESIRGLIERVRIGVAAVVGRYQHAAALVERAPDMLHALHVHLQ